MVKSELIVDLFSVLLSGVAEKRGVKAVPETIFHKPRQKPVTKPGWPANRREWLNNVYQDIRDWLNRTNRVEFRLNDWLKGSYGIDNLQNQYADITGSNWRFYDFNDRARRVMNALVRMGLLGRYTPLCTRKVVYYNTKRKEHYNGSQA